MSDSQDGNGAQIDQNYQDSEYCVNCETWESASFNSFPEDWANLEAVETEVVVKEAVRTEVEAEVHCSMGDWDQRYKADSDEKIRKSSDDLLITTMKPEEQTKNLLDYDINTTKTRTIGSIQNSDKQYEASKEEPPIASQNTDTSKEEPPIASQNTDTSKEEPPIASQNTDTSKEEPPIASQNTDTSKEEPPIASETTDTFKFESSNDSQSNGATKQDQTIVSETDDSFKQKPNIDFDNIDTYLEDPTILSKRESSRVTQSQFTGTSHEPSIDNTKFADELHESFVKTDAIQSPFDDIEYSNESDYDADDETVIAQQKESKDVIPSIGPATPTADNQTQNQGTSMRIRTIILVIVFAAAVAIMGILFFKVMQHTPKRMVPNLKWIQQEQPIIIEKKEGFLTDVPKWWMDFIEISIKNIGILVVLLIVMSLASNYFLKCQSKNKFNCRNCK